jgi:ubiquinone/menaquinone biosynthesis C-methylase UbiE
MDHWQNSVYDDFYSKSTIGTKFMEDLARKEVGQLIKRLNLKDERILDVACGTGRHLREFGKMGFSCVGVDISSSCVRQAKVACRGYDVKIEKGNMIDLKKHRESFDVVLCLFSSFGYFYEEKDNLKALAEMAGCLRPGGRLVIQFTNKDWRLSEWSEGDWLENKKKLLIEVQKFDKKKSQVNSQLAVIEKKTKRAHHYFTRMRLYSVAEMRKVLTKINLKVISQWDELSTARPVRRLSSHPVIVARSPF